MEDAMKNKQVNRTKAWLIIVALFALGLGLGAVTQVDLATQVFGLLPVALGGTHIASGTSGGILGYTATGVLASSASLAANNVVVGGGAGATPTGKTWADLDSFQFVVGGGTAQVQTATLTQAATSLVAGLEVNFLPIAANTAAAPTLAVNGLTAKNITKCGTTAVIANDLTTAAVASVIYDGTQYQLQNPQAGGCGAGGVINFADNEVPSGTINGANVTFTLAHTPNPALSLTCFENGVDQRAAGADFTLATATITYGVAPPTGYTINCNYRY
jgi:hypothetical protein